MAIITKYHCFTRGFLLCIRLAVLSVFLSAPQGLLAQCNQDYFWAVWSNFTGNSATGTITTNNGPIEVTMTANYNFDSTPGIFNYPAFSGFGGNAPPNATVPRTTWAAGQGGETTMCFSETVTNPDFAHIFPGQPRFGGNAEFLQILSGFVQRRGYDSSQMMLQLLDRKVIAISVVSRRV
jgi:hypothetical protein